MGVRDAVHPGVAAADHDHLLAGGADLGPRLGRPRRPPFVSSDPPVALVEVVHREVDPAEAAARRVEVAVHARAGRDDDRVVAVLDLLRADRPPDLRVVHELDALLREDRHAAVDHLLLELGVGDAEAHHPAGAFVALEHGHAVAAAVELVGDREAGRPGSDHRDRLAGPPGRGAGHDPTLVERALGDRQLDLLDRDRIVVDREHARRFARSGTDPAGELREVVGGVELIDRLAPLAAIDEIVPVRDQVAERAALVAERDPAVHAASALAAQLILGLDQEVLLVIVHPLIRVSLVKADPVDLQESAELSHQRETAASRSACSARARL